jgi:hypothetical protein
MATAYRQEGLAIAGTQALGAEMFVPSTGPSRRPASLNETSSYFVTLFVRMGEPLIGSRERGEAAPGAGD